MAAITDNVRHHAVGACGCVPRSAGDAEGRTGDWGAAEFAKAGHRRYRPLRNGHGHEINGEDAVCAAGSDAHDGPRGGVCQ